MGRLTQNDPITRGPDRRSHQFGTPQIMQVDNPLSNFPALSTTISDVIFFSSMSASAVAANSRAPMVRGWFVMHSPAVKSRDVFAPLFRSKRAANLHR